MTRPLRRPLFTLAMVGCILLPLLITFGLKQSQMEVEVYRDRLRILSGEYEDLRRTYNDAIRRTAITELVVDEGKLEVAIRTADGAERRIPTPFDPREEIYVDYVVAGGRLWIRRLFDAHTSPVEGLVIDPQWADVAWDAPDMRYGKAVYRQLASGRWVVSVTGDGSLGLAPRTPGEDITLQPAPPVRDFEEIETEVTAAIDRISHAEVLKKILAP